MDGLQEVDLIYDGGETVKRGELSENCIEHQTRGSTVGKNLPNGCVKHSLDDNGLVKLIPSSSAESESTAGKIKRDKDSEKNSGEPESLNNGSDNKNENRSCDNLEASPMHTSQNQSECDNG